MKNNTLILILVAVIVFVFYKKSQQPPVNQTVTHVDSLNSGAGALLANKDIANALSNGLNSLWDNIF